MPRWTVLVLLAILLAPQALGGSAEGPDADRAWSLSFSLTRDAAGPAHLTLDVVREGDPDVARGSRDLGVVDLPAGASTREVAFLPAEGAGRYVVALLIDGTPVDDVAFHAEEAGSSRTIVFEVRDEPTTIDLTNDDVNAPGKLKAPGETLITRAIVSDANGLADVGALLWRVDRAGAPVDQGAIALPANGTRHAFELRFDRAPLAAGEHTLTIEARRGDALLARASRAFTIREVAPTFVSGALANVTPDTERVQNATIVLADRNGEAGPGPFEVRVYRGSARAEGAGFAATLGAPTRLADEAGAGRASIPLQLRVPARAPAGAHRVSLYHDGALLASLPFEVRALPTLHAVDVSTRAGALVLHANATGEAVLRASLDDGAGTATRLVVPAGTPVEIQPPRRGVPLRWSVELAARADGPTLAARNGTWTAPLDGPALSLGALTPRGRVPAAWRIDASGWDLAGANASFRFQRWDGSPEPLLQGALAPGRVRVSAEGPLETGRYEASLLLTFPNGSASETRWSFEAGPWLEVELGEPSVEGRIATILVRNVGGVPVGRLVVETAPDAILALDRGNASLVPRAAGGRAAFEGVALAPGAEATLRVELPAAAGERALVVRVLARAGGA